MARDGDHENAPARRNHGTSGGAVVGRAVRFADAFTAHAFDTVPSDRIDAACRPDGGQQPTEAEN